VGVFSTTVSSFVQERYPLDAWLCRIRSLAVLANRSSKDVVHASGASVGSGKRCSPGGEKGTPSQCSGVFDY